MASHFAHVVTSPACLPIQRSRPTAWTPDPTLTPNRVDSLPSTTSTLLTTKFGNSSIGDRDKTEVESKIEIVPETEQESAKVQIGYNQDRQSSSRTR
uniref:Uncharacterized protein n=1 Tax=Oryza sativa subsp. japonica TaxID=39947 RepID=Q5Z702_ORYSJ|nr:hypothetical protein [Oryza sativa Japonica Group]